MISAMAGEERQPRRGRRTGAGSEQETPQSGLVSRNVVVSGRRTSMRLEPVLWDALREICDREGKPMSELCSAVEQGKPSYATLTSSVRAFIVDYFRAAAAPGREDHGGGR